MQVFVDAARRINDLIPIASDGRLGDEIPFHDYGCQTITCFEREFSPHIHYASDVSSTLDFEYMRKIIQLGAVAIPIIDASVDPITPLIYNVGDGQTLRAMWDNCQDYHAIKVIYGTNVDTLSDTIEVPDLTCYSDIFGLTEGQEYFFTVLGVPNTGYPPFGYQVVSVVASSIPHAPTGIGADIDSNVIVITWQANMDMDLSHYKILRKMPGMPWDVIEDNWTDTVYADEAAVRHTVNSYCIQACDVDGNESYYSAVVSAAPATFDAGILLIDETQTGGVNPTEPAQNAFYNNLLAGLDYYISKIDDMDDLLTCALAGQYNPLFWVDDDNYNHVLEPSLDTIEWYFGYETDFMLAGWSPIYAITGQRYFYPGDFYYDKLGISYIAQNPVPDFVGAAGIDSWPDLEVRSDAPDGGKLPDIDIFTAAPGAEVIYTFDSYSSHPFYDGKPVGIAYDTYQGKRVILGFPLYWLNEAGAQSLITRVMEYFAEESVLYGDVNGDRALNILDITYLINYLYKAGPEPLDLNDGDPNGDCSINILDITYLISYLYKEGLSPLEGCVI